MNQLREFREEAGITVRELSERSGVSEDTITKIENDHRKGRSMTLRKLARALGIRPYELSPEQFGRGAGAVKGISQILTKDDLADSVVPSRVPGSDIQEAHTGKAAMSQVSEIMMAVEKQTGLSYKRDLQRFTERQRAILLAVAKNDGWSTSAVAEWLGCSTSAVSRDLAVLEEHGLVTSQGSGQLQPTVFGRNGATALSKDALYFGEALEYVATLAKAYESVASLDPQSMGNEEALSYFDLQEYVVGLIRDIVAAATPSPLAQQVQEDFLATMRIGRIAEQPDTTDKY